MSYNDFIVEYLVAGLIVTMSCILFLADATGMLSVVGSNSKDAFPVSSLSLSSVVGALCFLALLVVSYPIGYMLLTVSFRFLEWAGRREIYEKETGGLSSQQSAIGQCLLNVGKVAGDGFAAGQSYERDFALIRLFLFVHHPQLFAALNSYWTRLSRMFAVFSFAFSLATLTSIIAGLATLLPICKSTMGFSRWSLIVLVLGAVTYLTMRAYCKALQGELSTFVRVAKVQCAAGRT